MENQIALVGERHLSVSQLVEQRELVLSAMASAMKENQHYGKIPGCGDKPTLLQPGAQLLAHLFRIRAEYEVQEIDKPNDHREVRVKAKLFHLGTGEPISEGVGICSTMESKHRFRSGAASFKDTGEPVPKTYWDEKDKAHQKKKLEEAYGPGAGVKKIDGVWHVVIYEGASEKVENTNPADCYNTVLKMAKKRAYVDGVITATASSDLFTQDLEDIRADLDAVETVKAQPKNVTPVQESGSIRQEEDKLSQSNPAVSGKNPPVNGENWKDVTVHVGKPGAGVRGQALGNLKESQIKELSDYMKTRTGVNADDSRLNEAIAFALRSTDDIPF